MVSLEQNQNPLEQSNQKLWKDYLWKLAKEYKGLRVIMGAKHIPSLAEAYLEMEQRFPDKESYERFRGEVFPEPTDEDKKNLRPGSVHPIRP